MRPISQINHGVKYTVVVLGSHIANKEQSYEVCINVI